MVAAWINLLEVVALLLQAGADTQAEDEDGETALDKAGSSYAADQTLTADMRRLLTGTSYIIYTLHSFLWTGIRPHCNRLGSWCTENIDTKLNKITVGSKYVLF